MKVEYNEEKERIEFVHDLPAGKAFAWYLTEDRMQEATLDELAELFQHLFDIVENNLQ